MIGGLTVKSENIMHVPRRGVTVYTGVDEEDLSAHTSKSTQSSEASRASAYDDGVKIWRRVCLARQDSAIGYESQCGEHGCESWSHGRDSQHQADWY